VAATLAPATSGLPTVGRLALAADQQHLVEAHRLAGRAGTRSMVKTSSAQPCTACRRCE
jgi:hypothetical protein